MLFLPPTDTCYGVAGSFTHEDYIAIYQAKGRDFSKQLALLVENFEDMKKYIEISDKQIDFLKKYPHPWSFLGVKKKDFILPEWMDKEKYAMISLRVASVCLPIHDSGFTIHEFPLFLTSANLSGQSESTTLEQAQKVFSGIGGIDGGICDRPPSDIFSIGEDGELRYLRRNYGI